ncbi:MAG: hypothetical protein, partial [Olavius algarvensis Delta 4 endosymbiont]
WAHLSLPGLLRKTGPSQFRGPARLVCSPLSPTMLWDRLKCRGD